MGGGVYRVEDAEDAAQIQEVGVALRFGDDDDSGGGAVVKTSSTAKAQVNSSARGNRVRVSANLAVEEDVPVTPESVRTSNSNTAGSTRPRRKRIGACRRFIRFGCERVSTVATKYADQGISHGWDWTRLPQQAIDVQVPSPPVDVQHRSAGSEESNDDER